MKASQLIDFLQFSLQNNLPVLIKGSPGCGKSDIATQAVMNLNYNLIVSHPVVADPTDYKGLPFAVDGKAEFLPFGDLEILINAQEPTVYFLDDLGQAPPAVQAACMQLLLARRINGHKCSDHVRFIAATNRREDRAGVTGMLEPVKSRFASIVELEVNTDDWVKWALTHEMPTELISFVQFRPELLNKFEPSKDMTNSPCPRTVAFVGKMMNAGLPQSVHFEAVKGACGESFAVEFSAFLTIYLNLPSVQQALLNPTTTQVPDILSAQYAMAGAMADKITNTTIGAALQYLNRMPAEFTIVALKNASIKTPSICATREFIDWASKNSALFM